MRTSTVNKDNQLNVLSVAKTIIKRGKNINLAQVQVGNLIQEISIRACNQLKVLVVNLESKLNVNL